MTLYAIESFERADSRPRVGAFTVEEAVVRPASRVDRLREDGWTECACDGCPDSAHGLVPPDGMVEAAAKAIFEKAIPMLGLNDRIHVKDIWRLAARAALVAAARWEAPGE